MVRKKHQQQNINQYRRQMSRIKFGVYKTPAINGNKPVPYARVISSGTRNMKRICYELSDSCSITSSDIKGVLEALSQYIGRELAEGYTVELDGLGHFSPALKSTKSVNEEGVISYSAAVQGVNFRCANRLKEMVKKNRPQKIKRDNIPTDDQEGRKKKMQEYLQNHRSINISDYAKLNRCTFYMAQKDIKQFVADGIIDSEGYQTHRVYIPVEAKIKENTPKT